MKSQIHEFQKSKLLQVSRKLVMLSVVLLGTSFSGNAHVLAPKTHASKVEVLRHKRHKKSKKAHMNAQAEMPKASAAK